MMAFLFFTLFFQTSFAYEISYIGDSHSASSYGLFSNLNEIIKEDGHSIKTARAVCGASIDTYVNGGVAGGCKYKGVTSLIAKDSKVSFPKGSGTTIKAPLDSDAIIIQLGGNNVGDMENAAVKAKVLIGRALVAKKKCIWIAPAALPKKCSEMNEKRRKLSLVLNSVVNNTVVNGRKCTFINSHKMTSGRPFSSDDCRHYTSEGYKSWAAKIKTSLLKALDTDSGSVIEDSKNNAEVTSNYKDSF